MAWSNKDFDPQVLSAALLASTQQVLAKAATIPQTQEPSVEATDINEYDGRMRAGGVEKFNNTCYISVINFYSSQADMDRRNNTKGAFILYMESENAGKFYKALEVPFSDDEDDASMITACGQFSQLIAENLKNELSSRGYGGLVLSKPSNYKNNAIDGVQYAQGQTTKHEIGFFYFRHKAIVVELTLAPIPKK